MEEKVCYEQILKSLGKKLFNQLKEIIDEEYYIDLRSEYISIYKRKPKWYTEITMFPYSGEDTLVKINFKMLKIKIWDEKLYDAIKKFGDKNNFEVLIKCWEGVI